MLYLPKRLDLHGNPWDINWDFRYAVSILQTYEAPDLTGREKQYVSVGLLFKNKVPDSLLEEAGKQMAWFLNGGGRSEASKQSERIYSWNQDLQFILSATDKVLGFSSRGKEDLHWWDFLSAFSEISEGSIFASLLHQRRLKRLGKQTKEDKEWWVENEGIAKLKGFESQEDREAKERFKKLMEGNI